MPTGNSDAGASLGNGRYDKRIGGLVTYLSPAKAFEVDGILEYNITGKNSLGVNASNEAYSGVLLGGRVSEKIRVASGLAYLRKTRGAYALSSRTVLRYTLSPKLHFEFVEDTGVAGSTIPRSIGASLFARWNF